MIFAADHDDAWFPVGEVSEPSDAAEDPVLVPTLAKMADDDALATEKLFVVVVMRNVGSLREVSVGVGGDVGVPSSPETPDVSGATTRIQPSLVPCSGLSESMQRRNV